MATDTNEPYGPEDGPEHYADHPDREPTQFHPGGWLAPAPEPVEVSPQTQESPRLYVSVEVPSTNDAELDAMRLCLAALEGLDNVTKVRVLNWLSSRSGSYQMAYPYPAVAPAPLPPAANPF